MLNASAPSQVEPTGDSFPYRAPPAQGGTAAVPHAASPLDVIFIAIFPDQSADIESNSATASGFLIAGADLDKRIQAIRAAPDAGAVISPMIMRQLLGQLQPANGTKDAYDVGLSTQELKVLNLIARGLSHKEIAGTLELSRHTIATFIKRIYRKLGVNSRTEAVFEASSLGIIDVRWPKYEPSACTCQCDA